MARPRLAWLCGLAAGVALVSTAPAYAEQVNRGAAAVKVTASGPTTLNVVITDPNGPRGLGLDITLAGAGTIASGTANGVPGHVVVNSASNTSALAWDARDSGSGVPYSSCGNYGACYPPASTFQVTIQTNGAYCGGDKVVVVSLILPNGVTDEGDTGAPSCGSGTGVTNYGPPGGGSTSGGIGSGSQGETPGLTQKELQDLFKTINWDIKPGFQGFDKGSTNGNVDAAIGRSRGGSTARSAAFASAHASSSSQLLNGAVRRALKRNARYFTGLELAISAMRDGAFGVGPGVGGGASLCAGAGGQRVLCPDVTRSIRRLLMALNRTRSPLVSALRAERQVRLARHAKRGGNGRQTAALQRAIARLLTRQRAVARAGRAAARALTRHFTLTLTPDVVAQERDALLAAPLPGRVRRLARSAGLPDPGLPQLRRGLLNAVGPGPFSVAALLRGRH